MKYVVKFVEPGITMSSEAWWPEGEEEECAENDAWARFGKLLEVGVAGEEIEGAHIATIRLLDASTEEVLLAIDPKELIFEGPWAGRSMSVEDGAVMVGWQLMSLAEATNIVGTMN